MVTVDDSHEVIKMILIGRHCSLVDRALALFTIAHQHVGLPVLLVHLRGDGHTRTNAQAVT